MFEQRGIEMDMKVQGIIYRMYKANLLYIFCSRPLFIKATVNKKNAALNGTRNHLGMQIR